MEFIIVTGLSGAGKSRALMALEDIGFYCVDNLPPSMIATFISLCKNVGGAHGRYAMGVDVRGGKLFGDMEQELHSLREKDIEYKTLFLDCEDAVLQRRYKETRRRHPLAKDTETTILPAIQRERAALTPLREKVDYLIDTSLLSATQLHMQVVDLFTDNAGEVMTVQCMSFGFKYGIPAEADLVLDVRCLPNPFYVPELKHKTGRDAEVHDYVMRSEETQGFVKRLYDLVDYLLPLYTEEGKSRLVIAIGCTGGKHRSVTLTNELAEHLRQADARVVVNHRDVDKR